MGPPGYAVLWLADAAGRIALIQQLLPVSGKLLPVGRAHIRRAGAAGQMELFGLGVQDVGLRGPGPVLSRRLRGQAALPGGIVDGDPRLVVIAVDVEIYALPRSSTEKASISTPRATSSSPWNTGVTR